MYERSWIKFGSRGLYWDCVYLVWVFYSHGPIYIRKIHLNIYRIPTNQRANNYALSPPTSIISSQCPYISSLWTERKSKVPLCSIGLSLQRLDPQAKNHALFLHACILCSSPLEILSLRTIRKAKSLCEWEEIARYLEFSRIAPRGYNRVTRSSEKTAAVTSSRSEATSLCHFGIEEEDQNNLESSRNTLKGHDNAHQTFKVWPTVLSKT